MMPGMLNYMRLAPSRGILSVTKHLNIPQRLVTPTIVAKQPLSTTKAHKNVIPSVNLQWVTSKLALNKKVTVITGGSRGIGLMLARTTAALGSDVAILDVAEPEVGLEELERDYGSRFMFHRTDVTSERSMENAFDCVTERMGRIDNCVTCAGVALDKPFLEHKWGESRRILDINILGSFFAAQLAAKQMTRQQTGGSIVMIASIAAHCAIPSQRVSIYGASKAAIRHLGKTLAVEMAPSNVRVNTISPGFIATKMTAQFADIQDVFQTTPPMKRIGQADDLAMATAYLLGDGASYTTGTDIAVTGGLHNGRIEV